MPCGGPKVFFFDTYFKISLFLRIRRGGLPAILKMLGTGLVWKAPMDSLIPSLWIGSIVRKMLELAEL